MVRTWYLPVISYFLVRISQHVLYTVIGMVFMESVIKQIKCMLFSLYVLRLGCAWNHWGFSEGRSTSFQL